MRFFHYSLLFIFLIFIGKTGQAQKETTLSLDLVNKSFADFVKVVESKTDFYFYYNPSELDTFAVTIQVSGKTLDFILDNLFFKSQFYFSIDETHHVYVTSKLKLQTSLPKNFFNPSGARTDSISAPTVTTATVGKSQKSNSNSTESKLIQIGANGNPGQSSATITGFIRSNKNAEPIPGAVITVGGKTATTNEFGYYTLTIPKGRHEAQISSLGMRDLKRQLMVNSSGNLNVDMEEYIAILKAVEVTTTARGSNIKNTQMGVERISIKVIKQVPVAFGEADVLRTVLTLPGVTSVGEASTGFNVRGGAADQNLILFNDATIYNPSHFFGFFSAFNPNVVKGLELYKSSIPEKYGGRLSSVLDVTVQEGNKKKLAGSGGIGPLTSNLMFEGPIVKEKSSFLIAGRTTYSNWILKKIPDENFKNANASFYDLNLNLVHQINAKNSVYLTGYMSHDNFRFNRDTTYNYNNRNLNAKWKHTFKNKGYNEITAGYDSYNYGINSSAKAISAYDLKFGINQYYLRADFTSQFKNKHRLNYGLNSIFYKLQPGTMTPAGETSLITPQTIQQEQALENALYFGDKVDLLPALSVEAGVRYSIFTSLGPTKALNYAPGLPRDESTITDSSFYKNGQPVKTYHGPEIRVSARYSIAEDLSIKISYNSLRQYIHTLSNTTAISPTDIYKLSDLNIKPQQGQQVSLGLYKNFNKKALETSIEVYYKNLRNYLDYKSGAQLLLNQHIETDVVNTKGKAYGVELMVRKTKGKLTGWVSYAYARTLLKTDDPLVFQPVNKGAVYPANFDKPHSANLITNYSFSHRFSISFNTVYSTGRPITLPKAVYTFGNANRVYYSDRNEYRIPDYFRADFSMSIEGSHKIKKLAHSSWTLGVTNITARKNPYSVYFISENNVAKGYKLSIFGTAIPFITYNFKF